MLKELSKMTALEIGEKIKKKEVSSIEVTKAYLDNINKNNGEINAFITLTEDRAIKQAEKVQKRINSGESISKLAGVPIAIKDNICTKDIKTTSASKMLENFVPPYSATVVEKVENAGMIVLGKTNMDEFAMGGSTETSFFGITKNPWNKEYVPGGSSGGSAASVIGELSPIALGSDTGGSIRQPCAFCNLTGIKPTYGSVSRYGLMAYASSLDQIGPMGKDVKDVAELLSIISGKDMKDSTSRLDKPFDFSNSYSTDLRGMKIGVPINYYEDNLNSEIKEKIMSAVEVFKTLGAEVEEFNMEGIDYAVPTYYIIACAEASSNLSRYDGVKFGYRTKDATNLQEMFCKSRSEGFGEEVKRRILTGSFVLSSGYFDAFYGKAIKVRELIRNNFRKTFEKYDAIISPVSPNTAYKIGEKINDPMAMYLSDIYTVSVNLAGVPSIALPCGISNENNMPIGMQLIGGDMREKDLIKIAHSYQSLTKYHRKVGV